MAPNPNASDLEHRAYTWKEECRILLLRSREKESKYEAEIMSMKSEMTTLAGEIAVLRTRVNSGSSNNDALRAKYTQLALENEGFVSHVWETEAAVGVSPA